MTTDQTRPEDPDASGDEAADLDAALLDEPDDTGDPETAAHEDLDPETLAHADDADDEVLAGRLQEGRLDGHEDGRLLD